MPDRLIPKDNIEPLSPAEIVERLQTEFAFVAVDAEAGEKHVRRMLATFTRLEAPKEIIDFHVKAQSGALEIVFSDDPRNEDAVLRTVAMPGGDLFFSYHSERHQEVTEPLIERCARTLAYARVRQ